MALKHPAPAAATAAQPSGWLLHLRRRRHLRTSACELRPIGTRCGRSSSLARPICCYRPESPQVLLRPLRPSSQCASPPSSAKGYIYNDRTPFEKLSDNHLCPVCGAPKRRFRAYESAVTMDANDTSVRKARKAELKKDEAIRNALPVAIVVGIATLAALYFYINNAY